MVVWSGHVDHHGAFSGDLDIPEGVGQGCHGAADPSCGCPDGLPKLVALVGGLEHQAQDGKHPGGDGGRRVLSNAGRGLLADDIGVGQAAGWRQKGEVYLPWIIVAAGATQSAAAGEGN